MTENLTEVLSSENYLKYALYTGMFLSIKQCEQNYVTNFEFKLQYLGPYIRF